MENCIKEVEVFLKMKDLVLLTLEYLQGEKITSLEALLNKYNHDDNNNKYIYYEQMGFDRGIHYCFEERTFTKGAYYCSTDFRNSSLESEAVDWVGKIGFYWYSGTAHETTCKFIITYVHPSCLIFGVKYINQLYTSNGKLYLDIDFNQTISYVIISGYFTAKCPSSHIQFCVAPTGKDIKHMTYAKQMKLIDSIYDTSVSTFNLNMTLLDNGDRIKWKNGVKYPLPALTREELDKLSKNDWTSITNEEFKKVDDEWWTIGKISRDSLDNYPVK